MRNTTLGGRLRWRLSATAALAAVLALGADALATDNFWNVGAGSWTLDDNWLSVAGESFTPDATFEEVAIINNGGVATLSSAAPDAAGLVLGQAAGDSGTLIVASGGSLTLVETSGAANAVAPVGIANIALAGDALLEVHGGGSFSTTSLDINSTGTVRIGTSGAGSATVTSSGNFFNDGLFEVQGSGHTVSVAGNATFEGASVYAPILTGSAHTAVTAGGVAVINGTLRPQVSGVTPSLGDSWDLVDAASITGAFSNIDISALPALPVAQVYRTSVVAGGMGQLLQLAVEQVLTLNVNAGTGALTLMNQGPGAIEIDGYSILSDQGALSPEAFNGLDDQNIGGADVWHEAGATAGSLSELNPLGSLSITGGQSYSLGSAYSPVTPAAFGDPLDQVTFEYSLPNGNVVDGLIVYEGDRPTNNLLLTVDPNTGEAQLKNDSLFTVQIDGYAVMSASGSLDTAGWDSLQDQAVGTWEEANATASSLNELDPTGMLTLTSGAAYNLGTLFSTAGDQDLNLEFLMIGETDPRTGVVVYGEIPPTIPGDYNNDGVVDAADYTVWRDGNSPDSSMAGYTTWANNFGATAPAAAAASSVPEPSALCLAGLFASAFAMARRRSTGA